MYIFFGSKNKFWRMFIVYIAHMPLIMLFNAQHALWDA